jgi:hypothetical protein
MDKIAYLERMVLQGRKDLLLAKETIVSEKKSSWTKWTPFSEWNFHSLGYPTNREIHPCEIIIETDFPEKEKNFEFINQVEAILKNRGLSFQTWFSGNKSYHLHFIVPGLDNISDKTRTSVKKQIVKQLIGNELFSQIDQQNLYSKRLIRAEFSVHPKTGKPKALANEYYVENALGLGDFDYVIEKPIVYKFRQQTKFPCKVLQYALQHKLPEGERNKVLGPNACAILTRKEVEQLEVVQEMTVGQLTSWNHKFPQFNCRQMKKYEKRTIKKNLCSECIFNQNPKAFWWYTHCPIAKELINRGGYVLEPYLSGKKFSKKNLVPGALLKHCAGCRLDNKFPACMEKR